jgi:hypothetical protein
MGLFSNAVYRFETMPNGVVHIYDEGIEEISVTNDAEDVLLNIHKAIGLTGKKVQYTDSDGRIDRLLHTGGVFTGFMAGPWPDEEED